MAESSYLERVVPDEAQYVLWQEHINRYVFALSYVQSKTVLDVACGTGYGTELISKTADFVVGLDISRKALTYAKKHYAKDSKTNFMLADANNLPFRDSVFDIIVSFETIEHLRRYESFLQELKCVLKRSGKLIISTPNGRIRSSPRQEKPSNPFHFKEFSSNEFSRILSMFSLKAQFFGQCDYTLKDLLFRILGRHLPLSLKYFFVKFKKISELPPQDDSARATNPLYRVKRRHDFYPIFSSRFFVVVVENENEHGNSLL